MVALAPVDRNSDVWPGSYVAHGAGRLYVRHVDPAAALSARPDGRPTAVLLHGLGGSSINWTDVGQVLAPRIACYAVDLPGFGFSDPPVDGDYGIDSAAEAVIAHLEFLVSVRGPGIHLVGNSLGGAVAVRVAARRPDLLRSLTLISPAFPDLRPRVRRLQFLPLSLVRIPVLGPAGFRLVAAKYPDRQVDQTFRSILHDPEVMGPVRRQQAIEQAAARADMPWAADALAASFNALVRSWVAELGAAHWDAAATISLPTVVIWGARDLLVSVAVAPRVVRRIKTSTLTVFEAVGHVAQMEAPAHTARLIADLVEATEPIEGAGPADAVARPSTRPTQD